MREKLIANAVPVKIRPVGSRPPAKPITDYLKPDVKLFSVELCPGKHFDLDLLKKLQPRFCSVTWHTANYVNCEIDQIESISLANVLQSHGFDVLLHLPGRHLKKERVVSILERVEELGIRNLLVLGGDESKDLEKGDFNYACELLKFIKQQFGNTFTLGVSAYPEFSEREHKYLLGKISLGASFIITNGSFNFSSYKDFFENCSKSNIQIPIIAGIFIINTLSSLHRISNLCQVPIPGDFQKCIEERGNNPHSFRELGMAKTKDILQQIIKLNFFRCIHIFSLNNLQLVMELLKNTELECTSKFK